MQWQIHCTLSNHYTINCVGQNKARWVGNQLVQFQYCEFQHNYYNGRHGVDDNSNHQQGHLSFEEASVPKGWSFSHLEFFIVLSSTNAHLEYEYKILNFDQWSKEKFVQAAVGEWKEDPELVAIERAKVCRR